MGAKETHLKILWSEGSGCKKNTLDNSITEMLYYILDIIHFLLIKTHYIYIVRKAWPSITSAGCFLALGES